MLQSKTRSSAIANKPSDACARQCYAVKSYPLVNYCDLLAGFSHFCLPLFYLTPSLIGSPLVIGFIFGVAKLEWLQSGKGRIMIDSVVWAQYMNVTDTQTDRQTDRQPRRHSKCRVNVGRQKQAAKVIWRKPYRICDVNREPHLPQRFLGPQESPLQAGRRSVQPCLYSAAA